MIRQYRIRFKFFSKNILNRNLCKCDSNTVFLNISISRCITLRTSKMFEAIAVEVFGP